MSYFLKDDIAERTEKWDGSTIVLDVPRSTGSRLAQLWWSIGRHSAFTSLQPQGRCPLFHAAFGKDDMSLPSLIKFCVHSQGSGMPPSLPSYPDLTVHQGQWILSLESSLTSGRLRATWALRVMPLLSASSLNQAQPECIDQELGCVQVSYIFSFVIFRNYFSHFQHVSKEEWGQMPWLCHPNEGLDVAKEWYWIHFF